MIHLTLFGSILSVAITLLILWLRMRRPQKPTSVWKITWPLVLMSLGLLLFLHPSMHISVTYALGSIFIGFILSLPMVLTSDLEVKNREIFVKRSKWFLIILLSLLAVRWGAKLYLGERLSYYESSGLFFLLASGMIFPWRLIMLQKYFRLEAELKQSSVLE
jgi:membrane protein CcdC involved in cytochrome C biogenesis